MDREKVIKGLKLHGDPKAECDECPYRNEESPGYGCLEELCNDVIALLKEQEAVEPSIHHHSFICPVCKTTLKRDQKFCHECGKHIEWKGW